MYALVNLAFSNWYLISAQDIPFTGNVAVIGPTGAGKSSLQDAMKTIVTGNHGIYTKLNSAAGDKHDRSVRDYCLGTVSDVNGGAPQRNRPTETTLAMSFRDTLTGHCISIGLMLTASPDQPQEETRRFVADGYDFRIANFIEHGPMGEYVVSHDTMISRLRSELGPKKFDLYVSPERYVGEWLQRMRPKAPPDAKRFLRAFANAMQAKEISDPTDFVRRFVLEPMPLDIRRVQDSIRVWRELEEKVRRLEEMLDAIKPITSRFKTGFRRRFELETYSFMEQMLQKLDRQYLVGQHEATYAKAMAAKASAESIQANHRATLATLRDEVSSMKAALKQSAAALQIDSIAAKEQALASQRNGLYKSLDLQVFVDLAHLASLQRFLPNSVQPALKAAVELSSLVKGKAAQDWIDQAENVLALLNEAMKLAKAEESLKAQREPLASEIANLDRHVRDLSQRLQAAGADGNLLSNDTVDFIAELRRNGIEPTALPEVVDITDDSWTFALESVLGPNREALIVADENLNKAFDILHRNRNRFSRCRVINTRKMQRMGSRSRLPKGSIAEIVVTDNEIARTFIEFTAGRFVRAETAADLDQHDHAIMANGKTNSGLSLQVHRDRDPILGKASRLKALSSARESFETLSADLRDKRTLQGMLDAALVRIARVSDISPADLATHVEEIRSISYEIESLGRQRKAVETEDDRQLRDQIKETEQQIAEYQSELEEAIRDATTAANTAATAAQAAEVARQEAATFEARTSELRRDQEGDEIKSLMEMSGATSIIAVEEIKFQNHLGVHIATDADRHKYVKAEIARRREEEEWKKSEMGKDEYSPGYHLNRASNALMEFCRKFEIQNPFAEDATYADRFVWATHREQIIENNELRPYQDRVAEARVEMEAALKEDLLAKLGEHFQRMEIQLKTLNDRLNEYEFVGQKYTFSRTVNVAMKPLYDLVRKLSNNPDRGLLSLQADAEASSATDDEMAKAMGEIERLVTENEKDIRKFEDYREYFEFELNIKSKDDDGTERLTPFSQIVGKLSGGQRQAPYYVAIGASMVSAYYPKGRSSEGQGMGLVVFDEAFNKLDVANTQQLIRFFDGLGLQIVVAAPEEKRSSLIECVDSLVNVNRLPSSDYVFIDAMRLGEKAKTAMAAENPVHKGVEGFRTPELTQAAE